MMVRTMAARALVPLVSSRDFQSFITEQLIDAIPEMRLCADLSHYVVGREMRLPIAPEDQVLIDRLIARSDCLQGRVASREQVQISVSFPQNESWVEVFKGWWEANMRSWRLRAKEEDRLIFLCELGPPPYGITGSDGYELTDRWEEALLIKQWAQEIWERVEGEHD